MEVQRHVWESAEDYEVRKQVIGRESPELREYFRNAYEELEPLVDSERDDRWDFVFDKVMELIGRVPWEYGDAKALAVFSALAAIEAQLEPDDCSCQSVGGEKYMAMCEMLRCHSEAWDDKDSENSV